MKRAFASLFACLSATLAALVVTTTALAHGTQTLSIEVTEAAPGKAVVHVRSSMPGPPLARAVFASPCVTTTLDDEAFATTVECPSSIAGARVTIEGLGPILSEAILVVSLANGRRHSKVLTTDEPAYVVPDTPSGGAVAGGYVRLGIAHILTGYDHLLFLVALVLLLKTPRAVILAETAFTVSHSLSFSATALGLVRVSAPAAEAAIALSLVLVALDIGRDASAGAHGHAWRGAAMAFVFGLVHGLGFAGGLREVGLPEQHVPLALLGFAGGVEIGQVAFLAVVLALAHLATRRFGRDAFEPLLAAAIGGVASYWLIERTLVLFHAQA